MDAEVIDARVGADGYTYSNLGASIRHQMTANNKPIKDIVYKGSINEYDPALQTEDTIAHCYYNNGVPFTGKDSEVINKNYSCTAPIEILPNTKYTIGLVPAVIDQTKPWHNALCGVMFYNANGSYISNVTTATFITPSNAKFIRFNIYWPNGLDTLTRLNSRCMMVKSDTLPDTFVQHESYTLDEEVERLSVAVDNLTNIVTPKSVNLYDPSLQTTDTISPHYWVGGAPYATTEFDNAYNCTAPIPVEANKQYTVGVVPAENGIVKPWNMASSGVFFFDENDGYISGTSDNTFITPSLCAYIRFNYHKVVIPLGLLNGRCMLVEGGNLPDVYQSYDDGGVLDLEKGPVFYSFDGDTVVVNSHYGKDKDISVKLKKKGGNNIFDFYEIGTTYNYTEKVNKLTTPETILMTTTTDWFAPYIIKAIDNGDGDATTSYHFTGGNHEYTNTGTGGTPTGRTLSVRVFADGQEILGGSGYCNMLRIEWVNRVQGYNTKKVDGSGREILEERHTITFNGEKWNTFSELEPLEDVWVEKYYGLQCCGLNTIYPNIRFIGGEKRGLYHSSAAMQSGSPNTNGLKAYGSKDCLIMEIDPTCDLGKREYINGSSGVFFQNYGKAYNNIILQKKLFTGETYHFKGSYTFKPV